MVVSYAIRLDPQLTIPGLPPVQVVCPSGVLWNILALSHSRMGGTEDRCKLNSSDKFAQPRRACHSVHITRQTIPTPSQGRRRLTVTCEWMSVERSA